MTFKFFIGGYFDGHFEVVLKKDELHFYISDYPMAIDHEIPTHVIPIKGDKDWQNFLDYFAGLNWKPNYENDILDGIEWSLTFKNGSKKLNCAGSNVFPNDFSAFTGLLKKITSKHQISDELLGGYSDQTEPQIQQESDHGMSNCIFA